MIDEIAQINVRDGTSIGARIYRPDGAGLIRLLGAAPYRLITTIFPPAHSFCGVRWDSIIGPLVGALFVGLPVEKLYMW